jgi:hypothetical protein
MNIHAIIRRSVAVAALAAGAVGVTTVPAHALRANYCQDAQSQAAASASMSRFYANLSLTLAQTGYYSLSEDAANAASYYALSASTILADSGCGR